MTLDQINEVERLASLMAMARVRRAMVGVGASSNPRETKDSTERNVRRTREALRKYLESLVTP